MTRFLFLCLVACDGNVIDGDSGKLDGADETGALDTADTAGDTDTTPVYVPDYTVWDATRNFFVSEYGYECDETVQDVGSSIDEGTGTWDALHDLCGLCDYFYEVEPSQDSVCDGYVSLGTTWRGVILDEEAGAAAVYFYRESDGGAEEYASDEGASFDGEVISDTYTYEVVWTVDMTVTGDQTYPLILKESE